MPRIGECMDQTSTRIVTVALIAATGVASFAMSFHALSDLAVSARIPEPLSYGLPIVVDGTASLAALSTLTLRRGKSTWVRLYPWAVVIGLSAFSTWANALHASSATLSTAAAAAIGCVPPISLALCVHLGLETIRVGSGAEKKTARVRPVIQDAASAAPVRNVEKPTAGARSADRQDVLARIQDHYAATGTFPSGPIVVEWTGLSRKSGARLVAQAREALQSAGPVAG